MTSQFEFSQTRHHIAIGLLVFLMLLILLFLFGLFNPAIQLTSSKFATFQAESTTLSDRNQESTGNDVVIELFYRSDSKQSLAAKEYLQQLHESRPGLAVKFHDVLEDRRQLARLWKMSKDAQMKKPLVPTFYLCGRMVVGFIDAETSSQRVESFLSIQTYIRPGCKHCIAGKAFLDDFVNRWPALTVQYHNVEVDAEARTAVQEIAKQYQVQVPSFPCIKVAGRLVVGFQTAEITGTKIEALFQDRSIDYSEDQTKDEADAKSDQSDKGASLSSESPEGTQTCQGQRQNQYDLLCSVTQKEEPYETSRNQDKEAPLPDEFSLPDEATPSDLTEPLPGNKHDLLVESEKDEIEVPWLGRLSVSELGLPAFTFAIGLVDGFNPCAMWVLIFLLSVLVSIKERKKILMVAGTFVIVSGLAYFVFMAAWFSVFQLIGVVRPVQIGLGIVAIIIGTINVKDFFAFHKGLSLSIPESAKPGIYRRVRQIVKENHMATALSGAIVLAIVVNVVELLCTAGLPALYTEILTMQQLPTWVNYSYLALYISAYMLDDAVLVLIVVCTLSNRRLQESEGRWLKLLSGLVILALGIVMIFWPQILI